MWAEWQAGIQDAQSMHGPFTSQWLKWSMPSLAVSYGLLKFSFPMHRCHHTSSTQPFAAQHTGRRCSVARAAAVQPLGEPPRHRWHTQHSTSPREQAVGSNDPWHAVKLLTAKNFTMDGFFLFYITSSHLRRHTAWQTHQHCTYSIIYLIYILPHQCTYCWDISCKGYTTSMHPCPACPQKTKYLLLLAYGNQAFLDLHRLSWPCLQAID